MTKILGIFASGQNSDFSTKRLLSSYCMHAEPLRLATATWGRFYSFNYRLLF